MIDDSTKPRRADVMPDDVQEDELENSGPGCLVWGILWLFGILVALALVFGAFWGGFNSGVGIANRTATAERNENIATQCAILPTDIAAGRGQLVQDRFNNLASAGVLPNCAQVFVPQATQLYLDSNATATPSPTMTPTLEITPTTSIEVTASGTELVVATSDSGYDLNGLLLEAQGYIRDGNYLDAISTLDAIIAIDPNFQSGTVKQLLFNALSQRAALLYQTDGASLQEAVLLTDRAAEFGDIASSGLAFERDVARIYMDAQAYVGVNYPNAIRLLIQVINLSPNYPRGTGGAARQLYEQYVAYGDAFNLGSEPCQAVIQYDAALQLRPNTPEVVTKRDAAQQACISGVPATLDPNATPDPNAPFVTPTSGIAPIGQPNN